MTRTSALSESRVAAVPAAPAALAAEHFVRRLEFETDPADVWADLSAGAADFVLVDARSAEAFEAAHLPGAVSLPHASIDSATAAALDPGRLYVAYCWGPACNASTRAAAALARHGLPVKELLGGIDAWQAEGFPVETGPPPTVDRPPFSTQ